MAGCLSGGGFLQEFLTLAAEMIAKAPVTTGPSPPDLISKQLSFLPGVVVDWAPSGGLSSSGHSPHFSAQLVSSCTAKIKRLPFSLSA